MAANGNLHERKLELIQWISALDNVAVLDDLDDLRAENNGIPTRSGEKTEKHRISELRGLGKHIWKDVDAQEYVDAERDSWRT